MNRISIVTVVYNAVDSIEETIRSVIGQSYENVEYIIIDGNSSDGTKKIIDKYINHISFYLSEPDSGIYDAMNKGINLATGDWILFLNSGDVFYQYDVLEQVFRQLVSDVDVIYGSTVVINLWGKYIVEPDKLQVLLHKMAFCHQSAIVRLFIMRTYMFDINYKISADYNLFNKLYIDGKIFFKYAGIISIYDSIMGVSTNNAIRMYKEFAKIAILRTSYRRKVLSFIDVLKLQIINSLPPKFHAAFYRFCFSFKKRYKRIY